jgi:hypothetical protein
MSDTIKEHAAPFMDAAEPAFGKAASRRRIQFGRLLKISIAGTLFVGALGGVLIGQGRVTADNAVVSAYVLSVRSPIQGQVSGLGLRVGDAVAGAALLAHVADDRVNDERLVELRSEQARITAERAAFEAQGKVLADLRSALAARSEEHRLATVAYAAATTEEAMAQLRGRLLRLDLARRDMARKITLGRLGDAAMADVDRVTQDAGVAETEVVSQAAHHAYLRTRESAAAHGVFLDSGSNDVSYSAQRIDEIDLRIADITRAAAVLAAARPQSRHGSRPRRSGSLICRRPI